MTEHGSDAVNKSGEENKTRKKSPAKKKSARKRTRKAAKRTPTRPPPPRVHRPRVTDAEIANRVAIVSRVILEGHSRPRQIRRALAEKFRAGEIPWYVPDEPAAAGSPLDLRAIPWRTVERYIQIAHTEIAALADEQRSAAKGKARGRYELALVGAVQAGQWDTVRKIVRDMVRLDGLEPTQRVHLEGTIGHDHTGQVEHTVKPSGGSLEERAAAVANLFGTAVARRAAAAGHN